MISRSRRAFLLVSAAAMATPAAIVSARETSRRADARALLLVMQRLLPVRGAPGDVYLAGARTVEERAAGDADLRRRLTGQLVALRGATHQQSSNGQAALDAYLATPEAKPLLDILVPLAVPVMLNHHDLWRVAGYEGESFSKGGYLARGFNDLNWLPDPPASVQGPRP